MGHNPDTFSQLGKSFTQLSEEFNYNSKTFWQKVPQACVLIADQSTIAKVAKDLIAGLFLNECCLKIVSTALDLSFYAKRSPADRCFLYDDVARFVFRANECRREEILVDFKHRGWYDKWIRTSPKTSMEQEFRAFFSQSENDVAVCFFGPWLATLLLRINKKAPSEVAKKISKFFEGGCELSSAGSQLPWKPEFANEWEALLKRFPPVQPFKPKRDALYRAMIAKSYTSKDKRALSLIEFTTLQTLSFSGMMLVKMIDAFREDRRSLKLYEIVEATRTPKTTKSWETYFGFVAYFYGGLSKEERHYAKYAREFDANAFNSLTYSKNPSLCNYLAVISDSGRKEVCFSTSNPSPAYKQLIANRAEAEMMTDDDFRFCANVAEDLFIAECRPFTAESCTVITQCYRERIEEYRKRAEEYMKLAEEAKKEAMFNKMRSDKYRKLVKDYERLTF